MRTGWRLSLILCVLMAAGLLADDRRSVPNSLDQTRAVNPIRQQYKADYARRTAEDQLSLARNFQQQAALASADDPVRQYVLLREARELATNSGNIDAIFSIIDDMAKTFVVDDREQKISALANVMDRALIPKSQLLDNYLKVCEESLRAGDVQFAVQTMVLVKEMTRAIRDPALQQRVKQYDLRVHDLRREVTTVAAAEQKRQAHPDDPDANLLVGRFLCFAQGHWDDGIPLLLQGSDAKLKAQAEKDYNEPKTPEQMADVADGWWDWPGTKQTPQYWSRQRAVFWYEQAAAKLDGARKQTVEKRIAEVKGKKEAGT
jgi:hypothetical protein